MTPKQATRLVYTLLQHAVDAGYLRHVQQQATRFLRETRTEPDHIPQSLSLMLVPGERGIQLCSRGRGGNTYLDIRVRVTRG